MITAKKHLGQHFLKDENKARDIVHTLQPQGRYKTVLEIGPGMGVLTQFLFLRNDFKTHLIEIDGEAIGYLQKNYPDHLLQIEQGDFLKMDLKKRFSEPLAIIGNFPYNISTQILFKVLADKELIPEVVGMFQKEVGARIASPPGGREYGILSVLMQAYYDVKIVMTLNEDDFSPPPKVKSVVLHFERKENFTLQCDEGLFVKVVKTAFNQRRKTLRNALKPFLSLRPADRNRESQVVPYLDKRAETLSWKQFEELTCIFAS
jgi:16S rRNA (adenine1518-N6/adenine1519-N6)-dimethyltransferase